jgi:hypothetical protein
VEKGGAAMNATDRIVETEGRIDPRLVFLHRAHSRLILVLNGLMSLDEAYAGLMEQHCDCCRDRRTA